ncbi:hypothetical protein Poly24_42410 [Rosistilla carotiformis]|uniref:Uncharacterized protein n=1 Tax=Rosistilla carotiformis TaxID=2528017 RepID=A0A518JYA4_9BACT|nr:hypothetical protein Poly24_42410 [Rosistilla carotiformis]
MNNKDDGPGFQTGPQIDSANSVALRYKTSFKYFDVHRAFAHSVVASFYCFSNFPPIGLRRLAMFAESTTVSTGVDSSGRVCQHKSTPRREIPHFNAGLSYLARDLHSRFLIQHHFGTAVNSLAMNG